MQNTPTAQAYRELQDAYEHYNQTLFAGELPSCLITFQREKRTYGYFAPKRFVHRLNKETTDEIAMNPCYFAVVPLIEILQTLVHEMTHLWQHHFGTPSRRSYHNQQWASKMESIGLMPSSTGRPGGAKTGEKMGDYPIPGGLFMQATEKLLEGSFQISWLDRFPAATPPTPHPLVAGTAGQDAEKEDIAAEVGIAISAALSAALSAPEGFQGEGGEAAGVLVEPKPGNRSNRLKYRCPSCLVQVWGKPGIMLRCGDPACDGEDFEEAE